MRCPNPVIKMLNVTQTWVVVHFFTHCYTTDSLRSLWSPFICLFLQHFVPSLKSFPKGLLQQKYLQLFPLLALPLSTFNPLLAQSLSPVLIRSVGHLTGYLPMASYPSFLLTLYLFHMVILLRSHGMSKLSQCATHHTWQTSPIFITFVDPS